MSRRTRAILLLGLAALTGLAGAAIVGSQRQNTVETYGELQPVVVTRQALSGTATISAKLARRRLAVVRVPSRFAPAGAIADPAHAVGMRPLGDLPAGLYLSAALLRPPRETANQRSPAAARLGGGRQAVEIAVSGSASAASFLRGSRRVDVVVTSEAGPGGRGRTYLAARAVPLLDLIPAPDGPAANRSIAVLGLERREALELIRAETYARDIRLLPNGRG